MTFNRLILNVICLVFFVALVVPGCGLSSLYVAVSTRVWLAILAKRHPKLQFIGRLGDIRSHVDTNRNYGVHHVLLQLRGTCNVAAVKQSLLSHVLTSQTATKDKTEGGEFMFPRLRQCLAKHYGFYAWQTNCEHSFNIDNHVVETCNPIVRGRLVTGSNIQEYVSQSASRYLSVDQPPWHIELISVNTEDRGDDSHFALVRIHHMLLAEYPCHLNIRKLLQIEMSNHEEPPSCNDTSEHELDAIFNPPIPSVSHIIRLMSSVVHKTATLWTSFVNEFESRHPSAGIKTFSAKSLIVLVQKLKESIDSSQITSLQNRLHSGLNYQAASEAFRRSLHPNQLADSATILLKWFIRFSCIQVPNFIYSEFALICRDGLVHANNGSCLVRYGVEFVSTAVEVWNLAKLCVCGPLCVLEMFDRSVFQRNAVHSVSIQGRKSLAWSDGTDQMLVDSATRSLEGVGDSLGKLLVKLKKEPTDGQPIPPYIAVAVRSISWRHILDNEKYTNCPFICINLPITNESSYPIVKWNVNQYSSIISKQAASIWIQQYIAPNLRYILPSPAIHVLLNFVSKRFPITVTRTKGDHRPRSAWGISIIDAVYFSPTQCNTGLSITLQQIHGIRRISVISDTHFNTYLPRIISTWLNYMHS